MKVLPVSIRDVGTFVRAHYLHKRPGVVTLCLVVINPIPVGVVIFAMPPKETSVRYGGLTWELARLFLVDSQSTNSESSAIAAAVRYIKSNFPEVKYLVSYADPSHGHTGTIYRASGWTQDGRTDEERTTPRFDYETKDRDDQLLPFMTEGVRYSRRAHVPEGCAIKRVPRVSKFRFVKSL